MSGQGYDELKLLNRKIDELVSSYLTLKHESENLKSEYKALKSMLEGRAIEMKELEKKYERVKLAGALAGDNENATEAKRRIGELVREIDNCIALLNR